MLHMVVKIMLNILRLKLLASLGIASGFCRYYCGQLKLLEFSYVYQLSVNSMRV